MAQDGILRLRRDVRLEPYYLEHDVDCRLLFMGDRYRQLLRAYPEAIYRLSRRRPADAVVRYLKDSPEIGRFYSLEETPGRVGLVMRDEMFREPADISELEFELGVTDVARTVRYPLPLDRFAALGHLVPLLTGDRSEREVASGLRAALAGDALTWADALLLRLTADGFVERAQSATPNSYLDSAARPRVTFVAHTSLLLQTPATMILMDPLFPRGPWMPPEGYDITRLKLGAICLSHSHWDHCDVATLLRFDKRTPVLIPKQQRPTIFNPPVIPMLRLIGFEDIREVEHWKPVRIQDVEIIPVPFHGEQDEPEAEIDHYTYVVKTTGLCLYGGVDAFRDTFGDMRSDLQRVREEYAPTLAFLPVSRMEYAYVHGGVNGFCRKVDTSLLDTSFQYTAGPDAAVEWVRLLDAAWVVPYATFTFNRSMPAPQVSEFAEAMAKAGMANRVIALRPHDSLELSDLVRTGGTAMRRAFLNQWLRATTAVQKTDRRLKNNLAYRGLKRLLRPRGGHVEAHHH